MALEPPPFRAAGAPLHIGLVLSGGGARGAYEAGVLQYLARGNVKVTAISGASIGALNGAVLGCADSLEAGARRLAELWRIFADEVRPHTPPRLPDLDLDQEITDADLVELNKLGVQLIGPTFARGFLESLAGEFVDVNRLRADRPVWVSVYPSLQPLIGSRPLSLVVDLIYSKVAGKPRYLCLNDLPASQAEEALLASAALPVVLPPRSIRGLPHRDGGLADNTPAAALASMTDLDLLIVVHLGQGAKWDAHAHRGPPILEVRPSAPLSRSGVGRWLSLLDLSPERVEALRRQGFHDAARCLRSADRLLGAAWGMEAAQEHMLGAIDELDQL
jgi:NTE family protein